MGYGIVMGYVSGTNSVPQKVYGLLRLWVMTAMG